MASKLLYPFIIVAGSLMAVGVVWNAQLRTALAASVSFIPVVLIFTVVFLFAAVATADP